MDKEDSVSLMSNDSTNLCFSKDEFTKENFSVDSFVSDHRKHVTLEDLREHLGIYLRILRSSMVELINQDYADFVNLSTNLAGLDKSINSLCVPLGQLREEVLAIKLSLEDALTAVEAHVHKQREIRQNKAMLQRVKEILVNVEKLQSLVDKSPINSSVFQAENSMSIPGSSVERIATELNQLRFHLDHVNVDIPLVECVRPRLKSIWSLVENYLERAFLESMSTNKASDLRVVLRICLIMDICKKIQTLFLKQVFRPYAMKVISDSALQQEGITVMLDRVLCFLKTDCKQLLDATDGDGEYEFVTEVIWPEVVSCLESRTPLIFSPGNPNHFHQNYVASMDFLHQFESICCPDTLKKLKRSSAYNSFLKKWNLPVYFQIRFREIAGLFEKSLSTPFKSSPEGSTFRLYSSYSLWHSLQQCWSPDVFLPPLLHRFWKLNLQLLVRFNVWVLTLVQGRTEASGVVDGIVNNVTNGPADPHPPNMVQIVELVSDIELLCNQVPSFFNDVIRNVLIGANVEDADFLESCLKETLSATICLPAQLGELVVRDLVGQCSRQIKMATDIPRLYRKTNREVPTKASTYVANILQPVQSFHAANGHWIPQELWRNWSLSIVQSITEQYLSVTRDVLTSVRKMEDSLKRLKKAREKTPVGNSISGTNVGVISDDDKIRLQFGLDVQSFGEIIEKVNIKPSDVASYQHLLELVKSSRNSPSLAS